MLPDAYKTRQLVCVAILMGAWLVVACQASQGNANLPVVEPSPSPAILPVTETPTVTSSPTGSPSPSPSQQPTITPTPTTGICSPLAGYNRSDLEAAVFNPYNPPAAGLDGPHQGVDFADLEPNNRYAREGLAVQAVLSGKIAAVIKNRFPYGNALLIETPLEGLPPAWLKALKVPAAQPLQTPHPALTCPDLPLPDWDLQTRSLYVLYAHMRDLPEQHIEEFINCGQIIGAIGSSGNALNPHLHLEIRVGPSGARFDSLAHYDSSAKPEEMANYCTWRVRGIFKLIDPMLLINQIPGP